MDTIGIGARPRVLLVEDEAMLRFVVADCFEQAGLTVMEARNAQEAIEFFARGGPPIDLVFTDVQMPGKMDGIGLCAWIRQHHPETRVLVTSGALGKARTPADLAEIEHFFPKPYCLDEVVECIHGTWAPDCRPREFGHHLQPYPAS
jgi:CheY-like chemotaxis protein